MESYIISCATPYWSNNDDIDNIDQSSTQHQPGPGQYPDLWHFTHGIVDMEHCNAGSNAFKL